MNKYQEENIMWLDEEGDDGLTRRQHAIQGDWTLGLNRLCQCVSCGKTNLTYPIMKFYNWEGQRFRCYKCQLDNK